MNLTLQERKALCGMLKYPEKSLNEIASILNINYWTLYKIKEKFKREKMIREIIIPDYEAIGFELFLSGYGNLTKKRMKILEEMRMKIVEKNMRKIQNNLASGIFYAFVESYKGFVLGVSKNYTEIMRGIMYAERLISIRELILRENTKLVIFPLKISSIPILFDYSNLLCKEFGIELENVKKEEEKKEKLKDIELKVLYEIVKEPEISLTEISNILRISKQRASKIKKRLSEEGWYKRIVIPNMRELKYEVLVFAHWKSNPEIVENLEKSFKNLGIDISNIVFLAYNPLEGIAIAPFKTLKESREIISMFTKFAEKTNVLVGDPDILFLSLDEGVEIKNHEHWEVLSSMIK